MLTTFQRTSFYIKTLRSCARYSETCHKSHLRCILILSSVAAVVWSRKVFSALDFYLCKVNLFSVAFFLGPFGCDL